MPTQPPPFHNPNNLTPEQYGASDGWRLLRVSELVPVDGQYYHRHGWAQSGCVSREADSCLTYRTRTPDPFAPADAWVKRSEREPVGSDLPLVQGGFERHGRWTQIFTTSIILRDPTWTHWFSVGKIPTPPARELTQAEKDDAAQAEVWRKNGELKSYDAFNQGWNAALKYARTSGK